ncbi:MAG: dimethylargininase [Acidimicrobiia bacterium]|nr:dimethylargininase [Acidimicrobiia bacterium]
MRAVPDSFSEALVAGERPPIDVEEARRQHDDYRATLIDAGYAVEVLSADEAHPDCPFIEDTAVILDDTILITRPGAESRRGEVGPVAEALGAHRAVATIVEPATIDGGDVMRMGNKLFVGRSERTNQDGINQLTQISTLLGLTVRPIHMTGALHLKSAVLPLDDETILLAVDHVDPDAFGEYRIVPMAAGEQHLASVLPLANGTVMATASAPETIASLELAGYKIIPIDISQFQAADGGLTCLSILLN